ncbi:RNA polymerase sigma factor [Halalkalibacterium halodurans]|jgi:RNA polymerase sigma-70 factor (ECF subfamily)|uniref:RNA polymerase sigma factor Y n=2 Tax=Halalkalibacterium halodurans TaxID=86665 RepID=Q9KCF6_HALH5|nr:RNA polymerase sigma factor [Halalkalibacterium halodurans]MDY7222187.1 RNA polymerase sigma factor [Halalkalibacterium halodurans]MDY7241408.1 RNA polymerase sigma factor [Halalkalibacterium halodurans]MED3646747.1 RNA polymerase sigma factor [Halalkalibacterium halodurans]MED4081812.1 RNA polymerase sigma factor [Halalkalibacterium halodurans]MED4086451.1 RNA polymerase sigma factor [Halalkalibacterium halodurans]
MEELLLMKAKKGDEGAFEQLIELHLKTVEKFAFQLGVSPFAVEDISQEVFIKVYRFLHKHDRGKFTTWLYSITLNVVRDHYRKEQRLRKKALELQHQSPETAYVEEHFDEEARALHEMIQQLDDKYKIPIVLHYFHDQTYQEIAQVLGITEGAVKTRMLRAKQQLKAKYEKVGEQL